MLKFDRPLVSALALFLLCLAIGHGLSLRKPLWNDEIYTQERVIEAVSYLKILSGSFPEGNNGPLFYLIQKFFCQVNRYHFPLTWNKEWLLSDPHSQALLRIPSNVLMSLTLVAIFYFFARNYSLMSGWYAFLLGLSSPMVWSYWVEARPYTLWVFLTTLQVLLFLKIFREATGFRSHWKYLAAVHLALGMTAVVSLSQIVIVSFLLWLVKEKDLKAYLTLTLLPCAVGIFYLLKAPIVGYGLLRVLPLIDANIPRDRWGIILLYGIIVLGVFLKQRRSGCSQGSGLLSREGVGFLLLIGLTMVAVFAQIIVISLKASGPWAQMQVPDRVFIHLVPLGIVGAALFSVEIFRYFRDDFWMRVNFGVVLGGLIVVRFLQTAQVVLNLNFY